MEIICDCGKHIPDIKEEKGDIESCRTAKCKNCGKEFLIKEI